ncbi:MAG TPA: hypothetical protein VMS31_05385, partial [Pyrinomonadaceae bacterium]|nr:hypothetical protein [Pyrinomonadaceae bacterium]
LLRIGLMTDNSDYQRRAATILRLTAASVRRYGSGFGRMLCALDFYLGKPKEIAIVGAAGSGDTESLLQAVWTPFLPNKVVAQATPDDKTAASVISLLRDRPQLEGKATAYVCESFVCKQPVTTAAELSSQLLNRSGIGS